MVLTSPIHPALFRTNNSLTLGSCDNLRKTIYINEELNDFYFKKVLCHELTHAAMFSYNIQLTYEQEELLADLIATYGEEVIYMTNLLFHRLKENRVT